MHKLAIFVEGQTELLFVEKLLLEIASEKQLAIEVFSAEGGASVPFRMNYLREQTSSIASHYVQIVNCNSDGTVKSYIKERYDALVSNSYHSIIGVRDVYPLPIAQLDSLRAGLAYGISTAPVEVHFILGVMEAEAWFIAEHTHFSRIDEKLTPETVLAKVGFDPRLKNIQLRNNPAQDLHDIYKIVGLSYKKKLSHCKRTVDALDYALIFCELPDQFDDLKRFFYIIETFLNQPPGIIGVSH